MLQEYFPILIVVAVFGTVFRSAVERIEFTAGSIRSDNILASTAALSATTSPSIRFGAAYARRGVSRSACLRILPPPPGDTAPPCEPGERYDNLTDYLDLHVLWRGNIGEIGRTSFFVSAGGMLAFPFACQFSGRQRDCMIRDEDSFAGLFFETGMDVRMSDRFDFTLGLQYGRELGTVDGHPPNHVFRTASLLGGLAYRLR